MAEQSAVVAHMNIFLQQSVYLHVLLLFSQNASTNFWSGMYSVFSSFIRSVSMDLF